MVSIHSNFADYTQISHFICYTGIVQFNSGKYADEFTHIQTKQQKLEMLSKKPEIDIRMNRSDSMSHYPFIDEFSTVHDILFDDHVNNLTFQNLVSMGDPARRKLSLRIFDEMKVGNEIGMKLSDVPEALNVSSNSHIV